MVSKVSGIKITNSTFQTAYTVPANKVSRVLSTTATNNATNSGDSIISISWQDVNGSKTYSGFEGFNIEQGKIQAVGNHDSNPSYGFIEEANSTYFIAYNDFNADVHEISLANPYDFRETSVTVVDSWDLTNRFNYGPNFMLIDPSGTKLTFGVNRDSLKQYTLSAPFHISTRLSDGGNKSLGFNHRDAQWNSDGSILYVLNNDTNVIHRFDASIAYDIYSLTDANTTVDVQEHIGDGDRYDFFYWNTLTDDEFVVGRGGDNTAFYTLGSPNDITNISDIKISYQNPFFWYTRGTTVANNGNLFIGSSSQYTTTFKLLTPYSLHDIPDTTQGDLSFGSGVSGFDFNPDGTKIYLKRNVSSLLTYQYNLVEPYNLSTANVSSMTAINDSTPNPCNQIKWSPNGLNFTFIENFNDRFLHYPASSPFDLASINISDYTYVSIPGGMSVDNQVLDMDFNANGDIFYVVDESNDGVREYDVVNGGGDISGGINLRDTALTNYKYRGISFQENGKLLFLLSKDDKPLTSLRKYKLSTPYQANTASLIETVPLYRITDSDSSRYLRFIPDGSGFFMDYRNQGNVMGPFKLSVPANTSISNSSPNLVDRLRIDYGEALSATGGGLLLKAGDEIKGKLIDGVNSDFTVSVEEIDSSDAIETRHWELIQSSNSTIYTVPTDKTSLVTMIQASNGRTDHNMKTNIVWNDSDNGNKSTFLLRNYEIPSSDAVSVVTGGFIMNSGDTITANTEDQFGLIDCTICAQEFNSGDITANSIGTVLSTTPTTIYTVPTNKISRVVLAQAVNQSRYTDYNIDLEWIDSSNLNTSFYLAKNVNIERHNTKGLINSIVLEEGDSIRATANTTTRGYLTISYIEEDAQ